MSKKQTEESVPESARYSIEDLKTIVAAGMSVTEARALLDEGYRPEDVLELAELSGRKAGGMDAEALKAALNDVREAAERRANPSNINHPGVSCFSRPGGDLKNPKGDLPFEFWYLNYPCHKFPETEHYAEWDLMAQVKPGEYTVIRKDSVAMKVTVKGETDANGKVTRIDVNFPVSRETKWTIPPKSVVLYQVVHSGTKSPKRLFVEAMNEWLTMTLGDEEPAALAV